ncbi:hypothetical protein A3D09_02120 [Candidatus Collierbacteria bacterium RIFCSPHIGHO2_02_FULL_49_10]|uniref:Uncharacterized protein n=1 Tax=Candidatus Collierbacteria bacterium RIFCSPHIGHO2_02_FULL_49_10 TaxID=1817723 RepID=A0A1F5EW63_9BACT|nr:MAG: hypothetical protein A3D09_02120 [Candidatus Collierbacteria bacterium RIFCSPHIGHO2_02_FULL_49_10]
MLPIIVESDAPDQISQYLTDHYYLGNLVGEVKPENDSIGLLAIKYLIDRAKFSHPDKSQAVFLIHDGHLVTPAGQNALLKTLEESKPYEQFIITTHNHHLLLETIISRCQIISLTQKTPKTIDGNFLKDFVGLIDNPSTCLKNSDEILSDNPKDFINLIISNLHLANRNRVTNKRVKILSLALECLSDLDRNINPKLALDHFFLQTGRIIKKST